MFQSLVITLREGVEAALIIGIVLGYLRKTGRAAWNRIVFWALAAALVASLVGALALSRVDVNQEAFEGWLLITGAVFVGSMVVWMWRTGKHLKQEIETKLSSLSAGPTRAAAAGLFLFVFLMVFREGVETVLFLAVVSLRTSQLMDFMGGILGLGLAVGLGVAFFKGSLKVNLRKFFGVTTLVLLVVAVQLLISGVHELSEARILPSSQREMALIGPIVNNDAFFFVAVVALCLFLVFARLGPQRPDPAAEAMTPPERRKARAERRRERFWRTSASAVGALIIVFISAEFIYSRAAQAISPPSRVSVADGAVRMPTAALADHKLHRFVVTSGGAEVRFIVILDAGGTVRAALDACQICGTQGYYQDGVNVICRHCGAAINIPSIGRDGGCNPIRMDFQVEGGLLAIPESTLTAAARYFR